MAVVKLGEALLLVAICMTVSACASLPNDGPATSEVVAEVGRGGGDGPSGPRYDVINIDENVVNALGHFGPPALHSLFAAGRGIRAPTLGVGDVLNVAIYESTSGGLFGTGDIATGTGTKSAQILPQQIDGNGDIRVPFAGRIHAAGRTTAAVASSIQRALESKAVDPQVLVSIASNSSSLVSVSGEVGQGGRFPLSPGGSQLLDVIALAGGPRSAAHDIFVRLTRANRTGVARLADVVRNGQDNVRL